MTPNLKTGQEGRSQSPDFRLLLPLLEKKILRGEEPDKCRRILRNQKTWRSLDPDRQRHWAQLAQMAGEADTALAVLAHLNQTHPDGIDVWKDRADLLAILGRADDLAALAARFKRQHGRELPIAHLPSQAAPSRNTADEMAESVRPFSALRRREAAIERYMALFSGREDVFARQWADKSQEKHGYVPVRRPLAPADVADHLKGGKTYGIYLLRSNATAKAAVIDADLKKAFRKTPLSGKDRQIVRKDARFMLTRVREIAAARGLTSLAEVSGSKGYHFWFFFAEPVPARFAMDLLSDVRDALAGDLTAFDLEVFPKQAALSGKGLGNLVKLPLGIHRLSGKPSYFPDCKDRTLDGQLAFLETVSPVNPADLHPGPGGGKGRVLSHPVMAKPAAPFVGKTRALGNDGPANDPALKALTTACPPLAGVTAACLQGKTPTLDEEKVLFGTVGFLPNGKDLIHGLTARLPDYNASLIDYKLSRVRGTVLGCRRVHGLLDWEGPECRFPGKKGYPHPLMHLDAEPEPKAERDEDLAAALNRLKLAIFGVERFLNPS